MAGNPTIQMPSVAPRQKWKLAIYFLTPVILIALIVLGGLISHSEMVVKQPAELPAKDSSETARATIAAQLGASTSSSQAKIDYIAKQLNTGNSDGSDAERTVLLRQFQ